MNEPDPGRPSATMPVIPIVVLFGAMILLMAAMLTARGEDSWSRAAVLAQTSEAATQIALLWTDTPTPVPTARPTRAPAWMVFEPTLATAGEQTFQSTCAACHGIDARGMPGLGKNLVTGEFVHGLTDDELVQFITTGRPVWDPSNTTGVDMPPKGGNPALTGDDLYQVVAYLRSLAALEVASASVPGAAVPAVAVAPTPASVQIEPPTEFVLPSLSNLVTTQPPSSSGAPDELILDGQTLYVRQCAACHGVDGEGVQYFARSLFNSDLIEDGHEVVAAFIIQGRPLADPREMFPHPPRGGYPPLTDEQVNAVTDYLSSLFVTR